MSNQMVGKWLTALLLTLAFPNDDINTKKTSNSDNWSLALT